LNGFSPRQSQMHPIVMNIWWCYKKYAVLKD